MKLLLKLASIFLLATALSGCTNFMNGGEFKDEFDKAVEIANSSEISVEINLKNKNSGTITPTGVSTVKRNVPFNIELSIKPGFTLDEDNPFAAFKKEGGERRGLSNLGEYIKVELENMYIQGSGYINYVYKLTILKEIGSILINPNISNSNVKKSPTILGMDVNSRYGKGTAVDVSNGNSFELVDYFDVNLDVEDDEGVPQNYIKFRFLSFNDNDRAFIVEEGSEYFELGCNWEDVGNGQYNSKVRIDLRNEKPLLHDGDKFRLEVTVFNDGKDADDEYLSAVKLYGGVGGKYNLFEKQAYSKTTISIFNQLSGHYGGNSSEAIVYPPNSESFLNSETELLDHFKSVNLIVLGLDENLGKNVDGNFFEIRYGFCQDKNEVANLKMDHVIPLYRAYDFESELADMKKIPKKNLSTDDDDYNEKLNKNFTSHFNDGLINKSIFKIPLPEKIDPYKDFIVKVSTDNGINKKEYAEYVFPAAPRIMNMEVDEEGNGNFSLYSSSSNSNKSIMYYPDPTDCNRFAKNEIYDSEEEIHIPDSFEKYGREYSFFVGSSSNNQVDTTFKPTENFQCDFNTESVCFNQVYPKRPVQPVEKLPDNVRMEIKSNGINSTTHSIKMFFDKRAFEKYETVFVNYNGKNEELYQMQDGSTVFNVPTEVFYNGSERKNFEYEVVALKDGHSYITTYTITKENESVVDNIGPTLSWGMTINFNTFKMERSDLNIDSTGSYMKYKAQSAYIANDVGDGLAIDDDNNFTLTVEYMGTGFTVYNKKLDIKQPVVNRNVNIPVGHLENGTYKLNVSVADKNGNVGSWPEPVYFEVNRKKLELKVDGHEFLYQPTPSRDNIDGAIFDGAESKWKSVNVSYNSGTGVCKVNTEKSGVVKITVYRNNISIDNDRSFPSIAHFPEEKVTSRNYLLLKNGLHLYSDKPFFVHILQSDTDWKTLDQWENHQMFDYFYEESSGSEVKPAYVTGNHSSTPYIYDFPWDEITKKYAVAIIIWADNKRYMVPIDMSLKD